MFDTLLLLLPAVSALIGWSASWLAIKMSFYPLRTAGVGPFCWQGVLPRKLERTMHVGIDQLFAETGDLKRVFQELEPQELATHLVQEISPRLEEYIDEVMYDLQPVLWDNLPLFLRSRIYQWARAELPRQVQEMVDEFGQHLDELVDLKAVLSKELKQRPDFMNRVLAEASAAELQTVIHRGGVIGGLLGVGLMPLWHYYPALWILPAAGFLLGFLVVGLARAGLVSPLNNNTSLLSRGHGLLLRRQAPIGDSWSRSVAEQLLTTDTIADAMINGCDAGRARAIIQKHMRPLLDHSTAMRLSTQVAMGMTGYSELKEAVNRKAIVVFEDAFRDPSLKRVCVPRVTQALATRMRALAPQQFQQLLWPAFGEEGFRLMLVGGFVGTLLGSAPMFLLAGWAFK